MGLSTDRVTLMEEDVITNQANKKGRTTNTDDVSICTIGRPFDVSIARICIGKKM